MDIIKQVHLKATEVIVTSVACKQNFKKKIEATSFYHLYNSNHTLMHTLECVKGMQ